MSKKLKLEHKFFETMEIQPIQKCTLLGYACLKTTCDKCTKDIKPLYPTITSTVLLMLASEVLLINDDYNFSVEHFDEEHRFLFCEKTLILENEGTLEDCILASCIYLKDEIKQKVQKLIAISTYTNHNVNSK